MNANTRDVSQAILANFSPENRYIDEVLYRHA